MCYLFSFDFCVVISMSNPTSVEVEIVLNCFSLGVVTIEKQTGAELDQAQYKLGLDFIFCRFGFSIFGLVELVRWIKFTG